MAGRGGDSGGLDPGRLAEVLVMHADGSHSRGSGYLVTPTAVLTAGHVVAGAAGIRLRFEAGLPAEWTAAGTVEFRDPAGDLAVVSVDRSVAPDGLVPVRVGRLGDRAAFVEVQVAGFPRWKLRARPGYRVLAHERGSVAVLANRREATLQVTVTAPAADPSAAVSAWEGMSGGPVFCGDRLVGVVTRQYAREGLNRLAATRLDRCLETLDDASRDRLLRLLGPATDLVDVVPDTQSARVRSAYREQVRDLAPVTALQGRRAELDELTAFCAGDESYLWWQAGPWAGKTALLSTFVLNPPVGIRVVAFFVTARLAAQSDSTAYTAAMLDQLTALTGEPPPAASPVAQDAHRRRLLRVAAAQAAADRERLVLVVDGLDEDTGTGPDSGVPSIAALLPRRCEDGLKVVLAGRPHPPIPVDVPDDHPLRTCRVRPLDASPYARGLGQHARWELRGMLAGDAVRRDIIGLVAASGGGLTLDDLEQLSGQPRDEVEDQLGGVFGRTIRGTIDPGPGAGRRVYLFAHETLREEAVERLGRTQLTGYRDRVHRWADGYERRCWPVDTPGYLLVGYPRMLAAGQDWPRLMRLAQDGRRHDRMLDVLGGDAAALAEIRAAQQHLLWQPEPDLRTLARLARRRDVLNDRNANVPPTLPALWVGVGHLGRAVALAASITQDDARVEALARVAEALATAGERDLAKGALAVVADQVERIATSRRFNPFRPLPAVVRAAVALGDPDRAEELAGAATDDLDRARAGSALAQALATAGYHERAERIARTVDDPNGSPALVAVCDALSAAGDVEVAVRLSRDLDNPFWRWQAQFCALRAAATAGTGDRMTDLRTEVERTITALPPGLVKERAWVQMLAVAGDVDRAERIAGTLSDPDERSWALLALIPAVVRAGDRTRAATLTDEATRLAEESPGGIDALRGAALNRLARAVAEAGDPDGALRLVRYLETRVIGPPYATRARYHDLIELATTLIALGERDRAAQLLHEARRASAILVDPEDEQRVHQRVADLSAAVAGTGDLDRAERVARSVSNDDSPEGPLVDVAGLAAAAGDRDRAERIARSLASLTRQEAALVRVVRALAARGDIVDAERIARSLTDPFRRGAALRALLPADPGLAGEIQQLAVALVESYRREWALAALANALADNGDRDRAERIARNLSGSARAEVQIRLLRSAPAGERARLVNEIERLTNLRSRSAQTQRAFARALAAAGDLDKAITVAWSLDNPFDRLSTLIMLVRAAATAGDSARAVRLAGDVELLARAFDQPHERARALVDLIGAVSAGGRYEEAEQIADTLDDLDWKAQAMTAIAEAMGPVPAACRLVAEALSIADWMIPARPLGRLDPAALHAVVDDYLDDLAEAPPRVYTY